MTVISTWCYLLYLETGKGSVLRGRLSVSLETWWLVRVDSQWGWISRFQGHWVRLYTLLHRWEPGAKWSFPLCLRLTFIGVSSNKSISNFTSWVVVGGRLSLMLFLPKICILYVKHKTEYIWGFIYLFLKLEQGHSVSKIGSVTGLM